MSWLFKLRGDIPSVWKLPLEILGIATFILLWYLVTMGESPLVASRNLPDPLSVLQAYPDMLENNDLIKNTFRSIGLNMGGYVKAFIYSILIGFTIGLYPLFKGLYQKPIDAIRFVPLAATSGIFILWFGIDVDMKINFLAFGIFIFLTPIVVQRISEVNDVYLKTVYTIGATDWQTIKSVYIPSVFSRLIDDIRVLTAISWTYIVVVETTNSEEGGLGSIIYMAKRLFKADVLFAVLLLIVFIGIIQDRIFVRLDKELFPHKFVNQSSSNKSSFLASVSKYFLPSKLWKIFFDRNNGEASILNTITDFASSAFTWSLLGIYVVLALNEFFGFLFEFKVINYLFGRTCWVIHLTMLTIIAYKIYKYFTKRNRRAPQPLKVSHG